MKTNHSLRKIALIAGIGYLIIFFSGIFANFFVIEGLVVKGDAAATLAGISDNVFLFRLGIVAFIVMVIFDLVLTWALYLLFKPVNANLSRFTAWFRLVNVAIFGMALFNLFEVLQLAGGGSYAASLSGGQLQAEVMRSLSAFNSTWLVGLIFFGIHLLALGWLSIESRQVPRLIAGLLILAGAGYLVDSFAHVLLENYADFADVLMMLVVVPGVLGELSFTIWLLVKGGKNRTMQAVNTQFDAANEEPVLQTASRS